MVRRSAGGPAEPPQARPPPDRDNAASVFGQVVVPHLADALALARWLSGSHSDAEDIVQEAALRAFNAIGSWQGGSARAWLLAIVRNASFTWLVRQRSSALVMVGGLAEIDELGQPPDGPSPTPESELIRAADLVAVAEAIGRLPLPMREVVVLRDINELDYKEIADVLNLPIGTVMSRLSRGRQRLATLLKGLAR